MSAFGDRRLLAVFAHPDDESFCCGGSLALAADAGVSIRLLCATRGEDGEWYGKESVRSSLPGLPDRFRSSEKERRLAETRKRELEKAARLIGIERIEYLNYVDGCLCNRDLPGMTRRIEKEIARFKPRVVLTFDRGGVSGHIDHVVVSYAATIAVKNRAEVDRLYCCVASADLVRKIQQRKPLFPDPLVEKGAKIVGYEIADSWPIKKKAVRAHKTQRKDWQQLIPLWEETGQFEYYHLVIERKPAAAGVPFF